MSLEKPGQETTTGDPNEIRGGENRNESQVFSYTAPWLIYSLGFSCKPNQLYKIAVGSFLEDKENQVAIFNGIFLKNVTF